MKLIIGNKNYSSWSLRPWLLLSHFDISFAEERVPLFSPGYQEKLSGYGGIGLVPILIDGQVTVWDSLAICEYVSDKYLDGAGWPADESARAQARACSAEMHSGFANVRSDLPMNVRAEGRRVELTPDITREVQRIESMWNSLRDANEEQGPWLFGKFSIADCMYAPMSFRFATYGINLAGKAGEYCTHLLADVSMGRWQAAAKGEVETIDFAEKGR